MSRILMMLELSCYDCLFYDEQTINMVSYSDQHTPLHAALRAEKLIDAIRTRSEGNLGGTNPEEALSGEELGGIEAVPIVPAPPVQPPAKKQKKAAAAKPK
jgi:hypothetical protein